MRPPPTILGAALDGEWLRHPWRRRFTLLALALVFAFFCIWPRHYLAKADLAPQDSGVGLNAILGAGAAGGLVSLGALVGGHQTIETDLTVSRSNAVLKGALEKLHLVGRSGFGDEQHAEVRLQHKVNIEALRGNVLEITVTDSRPDRARDIVAAFAAALRDRLAAIALEQAELKRAVTTNRMTATGAELERAQAALTEFRVRHRLAAPEFQLSAAVSNLSNLQARLQAVQAESQVLQQFTSGDNVQLQAVRAEIAGLQSQIASAQSPSAGSGGAGPNLGGMSQIMAEYNDLYREEKTDELLNDIYKRYLESVRVDQLSAYASLDTIEPPYVDPARQYNVVAVGILILIVMFASGAEFYVATPPVGRRPTEGGYPS